MNKNEFIFEKLFKKIVNDNFNDNNILLIHHFCRQCLNLIKIETIFEQISNIYEIEKNNLGEK